jgi:hypothetical protein
MKVLTTALHLIFIGFCFSQNEPVTNNNQSIEKIDLNTRKVIIPDSTMILMETPLHLRKRKDIIIEISNNPVKTEETPEYLRKRKNELPPVK